MSKLTRIHVNRHNIRANGNLPVLTVKDYKENRKGNTASIVDDNGAEVARVVYRPDKPLACGAKCWIETQLTVIVT